jgi:hypothetical protein
MEMGDRKKRQTNRGGGRTLLSDESVLQTSRLSDAVALVILRRVMKPRPTVVVIAVQTGDLGQKKKIGSS